MHADMHAHSPPSGKPPPPSRHGSWFVVLPWHGRAWYGTPPSLFLAASGVWMGLDWTRHDVHGKGEGTARLEAVFSWMWKVCLSMVRPKTDRLQYSGRPAAAGTVCPPACEKQTNKTPRSSRLLLLLLLAWQAACARHGLMQTVPVAPDISKLDETVRRKGSRPTAEGGMHGMAAWQHGNMGWPMHARQRQRHAHARTRRRLASYPSIHPPTTHPIIVGAVAAGAH